MKAMKLKSCFLLNGYGCWYVIRLCTGVMPLDFLPKASAAFDLLTQKYRERIVKEIRAKNVRWVTNLMSASSLLIRQREALPGYVYRCLGMPFVNGRKMRN